MVMANDEDNRDILGIIPVAPTLWGLHNDEDDDPLLGRARRLREARASATLGGAIMSRVARAGGNPRRLPSGRNRALLRKSPVAVCLRVKLSGAGLAEIWGAHAQD
jgi:hypothetical protein